MNTINKISNKSMLSIIELRIPIGKFYTKDGEIFVGCDNSSGDAFVEDFKTAKLCKNWLNNTKTI